MRLFCRDCGQPIEPDHVNIELAIAKCAACGGVFNFAEQVGAATPPDTFKPVVSTPKGFKVENWGRDLTISYRWYEHAIWVLVLFCLVWDGFIFGWYFALAKTFAGGRIGWGEMAALIFPVLHVLVGLGLTYACVLAFVNKTIITVNMGELSIWHGPLPSQKTLRLPLASLRQIFCQEREHRHRRSSSFSFDVIAILHDGTRETLLKNVSDYSRARFIEQELEKHLEIEDERVRAEVCV